MIAKLAVISESVFGTKWVLFSHRENICDENLCLYVVYVSIYQKSIQVFYTSLP